MKWLITQTPFYDMDYDNPTSVSLAIEGSQSGSSLRTAFSCLPVYIQSTSSDYFIAGNKDSAPLASPVKKEQL